MNLILLTPGDFTGSSRVCLTDRRHTHIRNVLRAGQGDRVACGILNGNMGSGIIIHMDDTRLDMDVMLDQAPPAPLPVTLVLALPRPKMLKRIIQNVTSLGVKDIYLVNSWRVEKSFWQSPVLADETLFGYKMLGLEQAKDTAMPRIHKKRFFARFVKNELPDIAKNSRSILAHPKTEHLCPAGVDRPVTLAVGPEGGWIDLEAKTFEDTGFVSYHMGARILTVETAITCFISRLCT
ncbi:MAG: 16S rRNA (uracil(1498)-N(3))-methyltransferase [Desulfotignum sp.]